MFQGAGIGAVVAGGFTIDRYLSIAKQPIDTTGLINILSSDVLMYTQLSAGLAIGLGGLSLFLLFSAVLRIGKFQLGNAGKFILVLVSWIID